MASLGHRGRGLKVTQTAIGAAADEADIDRQARDGSPGLQIHVAIGLLRQGTLVGFGLLQGGHGLIHADALAGGDAPGDRGRDGSGIEAHFIVEDGVGAAGQATPPAHRLRPGLATGSEGAPLEVVKGDLIGVDVTAAGAALNRHVAEGHPLLHRERLNCWTGEFVGITHAALHPQGANHVQDQVLGVDAGLELTIHPDPADLELAHRQALAGEHIPHLTGANAKGDRTESPMGGGVGVAAGHGHARLGQTQFGGNHVDDPLATAADAMQGDAVLRAVRLQGGEHFLRQGIREGARLGGRRNDVIHRGDRALGVPHRQTQVLQAGKGLGAGDLVDQMQADEQLGGPTRQLGDLVKIPNLVVEGAGAHADACSGIDEPTQANCSLNRFKASPALRVWIQARPRLVPKRRPSLLQPWGPATAMCTKPTGFCSLPPPGPATPVMAKPQSAPVSRRAPSAIASATGSLTAPWVSSSASGTPRTCCLTRLA